jgi:hypothetical protein
VRDNAETAEGCWAFALELNQSHTISTRLTLRMITTRLMPEGNRSSPKRHASGRIAADRTTSADPDGFCHHIRT